MTVSVDKQYLWPVNFTEGTDTMDKYQRKITVRFNGESDAATDVTTSTQLIDKSDLLGPAGAEPSSLALLEAEWSMGGCDAVILLWDDTTDEEIIRVSGAGFKDYKQVGGLYSANFSASTGDIMYQTLGIADGGTFDLTLTFLLKQ